MSVVPVKLPSARWAEAGRALLAKAHPSACAIAAGLVVAGASNAARAADLPPPSVYAPVPTLAAPDYGRLTLTEENDGLLPDKHDRDYTQGAMLTYLSPGVRPEDFASRLFDTTASVLPFFQPGADTRRKFDVVVGQTIFTPTRYHDLPPDPRDRPFAGYLFTGGSLMQDTNGTMLESLELLGGTVGPSSLAKDAQIWVHQQLGFNNTNLNQAWRYQIHNEPGFMLTYERKWRFWQASLFGVQAEVIPEAGLTVGNVMTYGAAGATFRIGQNLNADYGIVQIRPAPGSSAWFDASRMTQDFGWYLFAGVQGRAVAHNIFLDGNTIADSRSVTKNVFVGDAEGGVSVFYRDWAKFDVSVTERSKEFRNQREADHFGRASLAVRF